MKKSGFSLPFLISNLEPVTSLHLTPYYSPQNVLWALIMKGSLSFWQKFLWEEIRNSCELLKHVQLLSACPSQSPSSHTFSESKPHPPPLKAAGSLSKRVWQDLGS